MNKKFLSTLGIGLLAAILPSAAFASFHLMKVVEVFPGSPQNPNAQYVVIQMYTGGQRFVSGHKVNLFTSNNTRTDFTFSAAVANGNNQDKILIATTEAAALFGITPDLTMTPVLELAGGKACFEFNVANPGA